MDTLEYVENAILDFMIRRKRPVTVKVIAANVSGYKETELQSWVVTLAMRGLIRSLELPGTPQYVITTRGFIAWDEHPFGNRPE